jgi:hypothetical protein
MKAFKSTILLFMGLLALPAAGYCGGAWVPEPGQGDLDLGFSRKTANTSWDSRGESFLHVGAANGVPARQNHDFRYAYLSGEIGLLPRLSTRFVATYLYGLEGPHVDEEKNVGLSDAWFGFKYSLAKGDWPMALGATMRTPYFYDLPGDYNRYLFDAQGNRRAVSPEWRGLLKRDYTLSYLLSHSYQEGAGWMNFEVGYTWREGAPADAIPVTAEVGYPLRWHGVVVKGALGFVQAMGNDSPRQPDDRFGSRPGYNFNNASMLKAGAGFIVPVRSRLNLELGYNQWIWGKSAREYREPYLTISRTF